MKTCAAAPFSMAGSQWNGWGADLENSRYQPGGLAAGDVPKLKLKWAFAFPGTFVSNGPPIVAGGRVSCLARIAPFILSTRIRDASIGRFKRRRRCGRRLRLRRPVRGTSRFLATKGNAYSLDAASGELLWKTHIDEIHGPESALQCFIGGASMFPLTDGEEGPSMSPNYECCSGRGGLVALDASTGKLIWKTYTIAEEAHVTGKNPAGAKTWGPSGASIWSAPTIDAEKGLIYAGTGDNFSDPATKTSDAVIAFDMKDGHIVWVKQLTEDDVFNMGCLEGLTHGCRPGEKIGPDFDIGASPILVKLASGKRVLLVSQKSAFVHALDPDKNGEILWRAQLGRGTALGGIQWGSASDGKNMYAALSDIGFLYVGTPRKRILDPKAGGGLFAFDIATGKKVWRRLRRYAAKG